MEEPKLHVGIDIGTTEVRCVVGELGAGPAQGPRVIGAAKTPVAGVRKGVIEDPTKVLEALNTVLDLAEKSAGVDIKGATVGLNGGHLVAQAVEGVIALHPDESITVEDRDRVEDAATIIQLGSSREIIQLFARGYSVDGHHGIKNPIGMQGRRLEVDALIISASTPMARSLEQIFDRSGLRLNHKTAQGLAAAEAVLGEDAREAGALVMDIGASTTNIAIFESSELVHIAVIPMGSRNLINDLAIGLELELNQAELVAHEYIFAGQSRRGVKNIYDAAVGSFSINNELAHEIANARLEELVELTQAEMKLCGAKNLPGGIYLTGGGAKIQGLQYFFKQEFRLPVKRARLIIESELEEVSADTSYVAATGLMVLDILFGPADVSKKPRFNRVPGVKSIKRLFK